MMKQFYIFQIFEVNILPKQIAESVITILKYTSVTIVFSTSQHVKVEVYRLLSSIANIPITI